MHKLHQVGLTINASKCEFNKQEVNFYGYIFRQGGLSPDPKKIKALQETAQPTSATEVHSFLGMAKYSARFITLLLSLNRSKISQRKTKTGVGLKERRQLSAI